MDEYNTALFHMKEGVELHEYKMHKYVSNLGIVNVPRVYKYDKKTKIMTMQKIIGSNLSDFYGEDACNISTELFQRVRDTITTLRGNNIMYIDITGYNFMLDNQDKLWIIDFEHATYDTKNTSSFLHSFCNGANEWNADFK